MRPPRVLIFALAALLAAFAVSSAVLVADGLHDRLGRCDVAVVLGNEIHRDGTPSRRLAARLDRAAELYRAGLFPTVIVSGAVDAGVGDEAQVMARYLVGHGVPAGAVVLDDHGDNTWATARNTAAWMRAHGAKSVMVVTQYYHISRSRLAMRKAGVGEVYSAHAHHFELHDLFATPRDVFAYYVYLIR